MGLVKRATKDELRAFVALVAGLKLPSEEAPLSEAVSPAALSMQTILFSHSDALIDLIIKARKLLDDAGPDVESVQGEVAPGVTISFDIGGEPSWGVEPPCNNCGSTKLRRHRVYDGPTGVVAPDGGQEMQHAEGWECPDCHAVEEIHP